MKTRKLTHLAVLTTFALVIHTVEASIPVIFAIPGAKLGLANVITLLTLVIYGFRSAMIVAILRTILGSIFIGNFLGFGFMLSFSGAIVAALAMAAMLKLWQKGKLSLTVISIIGAVAHNTTQVFVASLIIADFNLMRFYLPFLLILAIPTGFFTGLVVIYAQKGLVNVISQIQRDN